jgi:hypothetical protein
MNLCFVQAMMSSAYCVMPRCNRSTAAAAPGVAMATQQSTAHNAAHGAFFAFLLLSSNNIQPL